MNKKLLTQKLREFYENVFHTDRHNKPDEFFHAMIDLCPIIIGKDVQKLLWEEGEKYPIEKYGDYHYG